METGGTIRDEEHAAVKLKNLSGAELNAMSPEKFKAAFASEKLFTVRDAIAWLSRQNPDAGLMYFEMNSNAWCDMSPNMFCTVADEKKRELANQRGWWKDIDGADEKVAAEMKEIFRYVEDDDICVRS